MAADNKVLGNFDLVGIPPAPRGVPQIEVTFDIDANGIVHVSASDKGTGRKQSITIQSSGGLSQSDIEKMVQDAERMRDADEMRRNAVNSKNEAETLVYTVEKQITDMKEKISEADKEDLNSKISSLRASLTSDGNADEIQAKTKELQEASWKVTQSMYANASSSSTEKDGEKKFEEGNK